MIVGGRKKLRELNNIMEDIEKIVEGDKFIATKTYLKNVEKEIEEDNIDKAIYLIKKAKNVSIREKSLWEKADNYKNEIWDRGISKKLYKKLLDKLHKGEIEKAENIMDRLEKVVENEKRILSKLEEVNGLIAKKWAGSNREMAKKMVDEAFKNLINGNFEKADKLLGEAKNFARPPAEFLLQRARDFYTGGVKNYEEENFEEAIALWENSIEEYEKAREIAIDRSDKEMKEMIEKNVFKIKKAIEGAKIAIDNREMIKLVEDADKGVKKANEYFENKKYDVAIEELSKAIALLEKAKNIAYRRKFEGIEEIEERINDISRKKEFYHIKKAEHMIFMAREIMDEKPIEAERKLYDILNYLESLDFRSLPYKQIVEECKNSIIEAKLKNAENKMRKAEQLYEKAKFYDAREIYQKVADYLLKIEEEAGKLNTTSKIDAIRNLRRDCQENINTCNSKLFELPDAPYRKLKKVGEPGESYVSHPLIPLSKEVREALGKEYEIIEYLGGGGFAHVFKVRWKKIGGIFAIKVPQELNASAEDVFFNEIEKWRRLDHRNIVKLIKPKVRPVPHLIIEYVDGIPLNKLLKKKEVLDLNDASRIIFDIARGLEYAHSKYIIHCDLKPQNILVSKIGEAKITDFGIAKTVVTTSREGLRGITLAYAAPEQLEDKADERTDIYQLGLLFYEMITGINPFNLGERKKMEKKIREELPPPPSRYNKKAEPLDDIIMECLSKDPDKRPSLRQIRETIYQFMKKTYGESLHLTENRKSYVRLALTNAFYAAKNGDYEECIANLELAKEKITVAKKRNELDNFIQQLMEMKKEKIEIGDGTIEKIEEMLRTQN